MQRERKRVLMLVCTQIQLMLVLQIRSKMLQNKEVDVILISKKLEAIYANQLLEAIFDKVYYVDDKKLKKWEMIIAFFNPGYAIKKYVSIQQEAYSDIFFWNPNWIYYYLYKYQYISNNFYKWHLISDACGSYVAETPEIRAMYPPRGLGQLLNFIDVKIWKYGKIEEQKYDIYLWNPEYLVYKPVHKVIAVPCIDIKEKDYILSLNRIFNYEHLPVEEDIIFLDTASDGAYDESVLVRIIDEVAQIAGDRRIAIKKHPRDTIEKYGLLRKNVRVIENNFAWELFCLNEGTGAKTIIGYLGSTLVLPYILFGLKQKVYVLNDIIPTSDLYPQISQRYDLLLKRIENENDKFKLIYSLDELKSELNGK